MHSERSGNRVILAVSDADEPTDQNAVGTLIEARVGVIIAATLMLPDVEVRALAQSVPVVSVARKVPGVDSVYADDEAGAAAATSYLLDLGHRRIAHITGIEYEGHLLRRRAYEAAMTNAGLRPQTVVAQGYSQDAAERTARAILNVGRPPDGCVRTQRRDGLRCPRSGALARLAHPTGFVADRLRQFAGRPVARNRSDVRRSACASARTGRRCGGFGPDAARECAPTGRPTQARPGGAGVDRAVRAEVFDTTVTSAMCAASPIAR